MSTRGFGLPPHSCGHSATVPSTYSRNIGNCGVARSRATNRIADASSSMFEKARVELFQTVTIVNANRSAASAPAQVAHELTTGAPSVTPIRCDQRRAKSVAQTAMPLQIAIVHTNATHEGIWLSQIVNGYLFSSLATCLIESAHASVSLLVLDECTPSPQK